MKKGGSIDEFLRHIRHAPLRHQIYTLLLVIYFAHRSFIDQASLLALFFLITAQYPQFKVVLTLLFNIIVLLYVLLAELYAVVLFARRRCRWRPRLFTPQGWLIIISLLITTAALYLISSLSPSHIAPWLVPLAAIIAAYTIAAFFLIMARLYYLFLKDIFTPQTFYHFP